MEILKADLPLTCFRDNNGAQVRLCMGVCNSYTIHMQVDGLLRKGGSPVFGCAMKIYMCKHWYGYQFLHLSFKKKILHYSKLSSAERHISRGDEETASPQRFYPGHEQEVMI